MATMLDGKAPCDLNPVGVDRGGGFTRKPRHLTGMRSENRRGLGMTQALDFQRQIVQPIGIDDPWDLLNFATASVSQFESRR